MKTFFKFVTLHYNDIDLADRRFKISNDKNCQDLIQSISRFGLLVPPLLSKQRKRYVPISGFRRIQALRYCGIDTFDALVSDCLDDLDCTRISIQDNAFQRQLLLSEQIRSAKVIASFFSDHEKNDAFFETVCEALNIPLNQPYVLKLWKASSMSECLMDLIVNERVSLEVVLEMMEIDSDSQGKIHSIFSEFKVSVSKQKEFILLIREVAAKDKIPLSEVLDDILSLLNHLDHIQDTNARFSEIRNCLNRRRYPEMTRILEKQGDLVSKLRLPNGIKLNVPDFLEGSTYSIQFSFKSIQHLNEMKKKLDLICIKPELGMILDREYSIK